MKFRVWMLASVAMAAPAIAQDAAPPSDQLQDIVVTANKRAENIQNVPASISVITGESLLATGVSAPDKLALVTPGLVFETTNGFAQPFIRGIGSDQVGPAAELPTSIYLDGVYISTPSGGLQQFGDVERVEVLKGPQGTLYGRNSTGGAINIITRTPGDGFSGNVNATLGTRGIARGMAYFGGGNDIVRASISGVYTRHNGWMKNLVNGNGLNDEDQGGVRGKVVVTPIDNWSITLAGDFYRSNDYSGSGFTSVFGKPVALLLGGRFSTDPRKTYSDITLLKHKESQLGASVTVRGQLPSFDVVSISGYRDSHRDSFTDLDGSDARLAVVYGPQPLKSFSQELQLVSNTSGPLEWIVGGFYFWSKGGYDHLTVDQPLSTPRITQIFGLQSTNAYAGFGQAKYNFTENWALTVGGRYNHEVKRLTDSRVVIPAFGLTIPFALSSLSTNNFSPKILLEYKTDDMLLYATASKGFKSGGYNLASPGNAPVKPEKITAYEIGGKYTLLDRRVRFNWAGFLNDYKNLQVTTIGSGTGLTQLANAASTRSYGIDVDVSAVLSRQLRVTVAGEWLHSRFRDFANAQVFLPDPATGGFGFVSATCTTTAANPCNVAGNDTTRSPHFTGSAQIDYSVPVSPGDLKFTAAYRYSSRYFFDSANKISQGSYHQLNLRAGIALNNGLTLTAFVDNAFNETVLAGVAQTAAVTLGQYTAPRTYGVMAGFSF